MLLTSGCALISIVQKTSSRCCFWHIESCLKEIIIMKRFKVNKRDGLRCDRWICMGTIITVLFSWCRVWPAWFNGYLHVYDSLALPCPSCGYIRIRSQKMSAGSNRNHHNIGAEPSHIGYIFQSQLHISSISDRIYSHLCLRMFPGLYRIAVRLYAFVCSCSQSFSCNTVCKFRTGKLMACGVCWTFDWAHLPHVIWTTVSSGLWKKTTSY